MFLLFDTKLSVVVVLDEAPAEILEKYQYIAYRDRKPYAALIELCDQTVKNVTTALKNYEMFDNTVIIFLSGQSKAHATW